jgi:branched-chain amino acid transport system substrate-binding protein
LIGIKKMLRRRFLSLAPKLVAATAAPTLISSAFAQDGVSAKAIMIGSTCAMSGPLGGYGLSIKSGTQAAMQEINSKGGVAGRQLQFLMLDDAYAAPRSVENFKQLIAGESILALLSCTGTGNNAALLPLVEEAGIPYVRCQSAQGRHEKRLPCACRLHRRSEPPGAKTDWYGYQ